MDDHEAGAELDRVMVDAEAEFWGLGPVHTGRVSRFACEPFDVACNLCEHSRSLQCVP